jgi:hypothetical protein
MRTLCHVVIVALVLGAAVAAWSGYQGPLLGILLASAFCQ